MSPVRLHRLAAAAVLAAVLAAGCQREAPPIQRHEFLAFGTLVELSLAGVSPELAAEAVATVRQDLEFMHFAWHAWKPGPLGRTNKLLATGAWFSANPSVLPLVTRARELSAASGGLFNPALGNLIRLWGFQADAPPAAPPEPEAVAALLRDLPTMADIEIRGVRMRGHHPALRLDLGGMAKGWAVDRISENLKRLGVKNAIVNAGGDLRAFGRAGDRPWRIGIRHPRRAGAIASVTIEGDEAVFTSGDYERYFEYRGRRYHHILDPRTGYPATGTRSVTVIHHDGALADAAATALFVAGPEAWRETAARMGVRQVMLIDAGGGIHLTPEMARRLTFEMEVPPPRVEPLP